MTWWHTVDYKKRDNEPGLLNRGFWVRDLPRPVLTCRVFGHRPVVDGYGPTPPGTHAARWVVCDRCGARPDPQGVLNTDHHTLGARYTGTFDNSPPPSDKLSLPANRPPGNRTPGPWPTNPTWDLSAQLLLGGAFPGASAHLRVGNGGSENSLAAHLHLGPLFGLYLATGELGRGIQRRLNPTDHESKIIELRTMAGLLSWKLWTNRNSSTHTTPRWKDGHMRINPIDILWGPKRNHIEDLGEPVTTTLTFPNGETHQVTFQLQRYTLHRARRHHPISITYRAQWDTEPGIPTRPTGRRIQGSTVPIATRHTNPDQFPPAATAALTERIALERHRHDYYASQTPPAT